ncbi:hypothetical protein [Deinococcus planocerae]|uniref:hypothetical protein n=1 Tax=Deinococcus planocerae TaxID=1737569 RepID=UPI000C7EDE3D|nr:hypothetical protein [Deinococcus planocerae]
MRPSRRSPRVWAICRARPDSPPGSLLILLLCLLAALWWPGSGRAQNATYFAADLQAAPRTVLVSPDYLTVIEFYQEVDQISSGRPELLHVEASGAKVYVSALGRSGSTDLVVEVGARTQLLRVEIVPGNNTRRYVVRLDRPAPPLRVTPPPPPPPASRPAPARTVNPAWLSFRVTAGDLDGRPDAVTLLFAVEHRGSAPLLVLNAADLRVRQGGTAVAVQVRQGLDPATLRRGRTHQGTLVLRLGAAQRRGAPITLSWTLRDPSTQTSYVVERRLDARTLAPVRP